jgi:ABC-type nickel/cobalt efflux system permease component RcnA
VTKTASIAILTLLATATLAHAGSSLGIGNNDPGAGAPPNFVIEYMPWLAKLMFYVNAMQAQFYRPMVEALKGMRTDIWQLWPLIGISFLYGVFHAAGPGHGKAVISSYMIANKVELRRGIVISFLSALVQGAMAILVVTAGFLILRGTTITMNDAQKWLEVGSFALIVAFGVLMLARKLRSLVWRPALALVPAGPDLAVAGMSGMNFREGTEHGHRHGPGLSHPHAHKAGEVCEVCGHAHVPSVDMVAGEEFSLASAWTAIIAVGLRPCTGALFVLTFCFLNGLYFGGALSVLGMSIGTAITVSILATIAVTAKGAALKIAGDGSAGLWIGHALEIAAAVFVILFGLLFLLASLYD